MEDKKTGSLKKSFFDRLNKNRKEDNRGSFAYKFLMYPTDKQIEKLEKMLEIGRYVYNEILAERARHLPQGISFIELQNYFVKNLFYFNPEILLLGSAPRSYILYKLKNNLEALNGTKSNGGKIGKLRFKGKGMFKSLVYSEGAFKFEQEKENPICGKLFSLNEPTQLRLDDFNSRYGFNLRRLDIGDIKIKSHRKVMGEIKQAIIKKEGNKWQLILVTTYKPKTKCGSGIIAFDIGSSSSGENFLVDSNGKSYKNPMVLGNKLKELKKESRQLSRKKIRSKNYKKSAERLAKIYLDISNKRKDFLHQLTTELIRQNKIIIVEDLNLKELQSISYNAINWNDISAGEFLRMLCYKAERAGCKVVKVNPAYTTRTCSKCSHINKKLKLSERTFVCEDCGNEISRDGNAAKNILAAGLKLASGPECARLSVDEAKVSVEAGSPCL